MQNAVGTNHRVRFKAFELDLHTRELYRNGIRLRVQGQPIDVLEMLLERPGELVTREQLRKKLWPEDTFVDFEHSLNSAVTRLRDALGDRADDPKYIETLPRLGYRFLAIELDEEPSRPANSDSRNEGALRLPQVLAIEPVAETRSITVAPSPLVLPAASPRRKRLRWIFITASTVSLLTAVVILWYAMRPLAPPYISETRRITNDPRWAAKRVLGTDGSRVLVSMLYPPALGQVQALGGEISSIPLLVPGFLPSAVEWLGWVSPDGTKVLVYGEFHGAKDPREEGMDLWVAATTGNPVRYLTRTGSSGYTASWSPDSRQVIYSTNDGKIYTVSANGGEPRLLCTLNATSNHFSFSPDGKRIRFTYHAANGRRIWEMSSNGMGMHEVLPNWRPGEMIYSVQWTPDGDLFLFLLQENPSRGIAGTPTFQIWALDERKRGLHRPNPNPVELASGAIKWLGAVPSHNGRTIFSQGMTFRGELVRYNLKKRQLEPYFDARSIEMLDFSRDGRYVTFSSFPDGILWRANRDGTGIQQVTEAPVWYPVNPRISPDGSQIVFFDKFARSHPSAIYQVSSSGGTPRRVLVEDTVDQEDPTWSSDGRELAYLASGGVRILNLATLESRALPRAPKPAWSPRWSRDGRYIACVINSFPKNNGVQIYDFKLQSWKILFETAKWVDWPAWSKDGRWIYFLGGEPLENRVGFYRIPVNGGAPELVADLPGFRGTGYGGAWGGLDPDDNPIWLRDAGTTEVYALTLDRQ